MKDISVMIDDVRFNYRVGLIIENNDDVLVEFNPKVNFVVIPGGRVKILESTKQAIRREIMEELKYELKDEEFYLCGVVENFFEYNLIKNHELYFIYKMKIDNNHELFKEKLINFDSEQSYFKWVKKGDLDNAKLLPEVLINFCKTDGFNTYICK